MTKTIKTPAKINLYLDVLGKRADGYHNIKSIMQTVSLYDTVSVTEDSEISIECDNENVPADRKNIAYKSAELFFEKSGISGGCKIKIEKNIPIAGGLAGGSTDGAAVLLLLNSVYDNPFTERELLNMSASIGADVPFCIKKGCAVCEGIGEIMTDVPSKLSCDIVIARGGESVSTPASYRLLDEKFGERLNVDFGNVENVTEALKTGNTELLKSSAYNVFEEVVLPAHSCAAKIKSLMYDNGAVFSMMSGSGPSVFGIFEDAETAKSAAERITACGYDAFPCHTVY